MKTKFFTRKGDGGQTRVGSKEVFKGDLVFDLLGSLDELNSWLGACRVAAEKNFYSRRDLRLVIDIFQVVKNIQNSLFIVQAEIAAVAFGYARKNKIGPAKVKFLEELIKKIDRAVPPIKKFIVPGGSELSVYLDYGRALARRAERLAHLYNGEKQLPKNLLSFLNRLSSMLFALARYANFALGIKEENPNYK